MIKRRNWAIAIIITATAGVFALQNVSAPPSSEIPTNTNTVTPTNSPTITLTPTYEGCGYMWAYHDDPELSAKFNEIIQALDPTATANVQLYGEDCVYADGHSTFSTMETDFYVRLPTQDLTTEESFGDWIKQIMDVIITLPEDQVQGRKGFVEFSFIKSETEKIILRVEISNYLNIASEITSGGELFKNFYTPVPTPHTPIPSTPTP